MRRILQEVRRIAGTRATVLITGESGTGKEMIANLLHSKGPNPKAPFVAVNCAALPESLLEAELFGHVKGAFTGATQDRAGRFEEAEGGSLFLDEIGEIPASVQVKLLRVLQEREIVRVGENRPRSVSFRLIAATNVDLEAEVAARRFREDLYYRLNVVRMHLPPLRERPEDIRPLATRFVRECAEQNGVPPRPVSDAAMQTLTAYPLPGNVRQLHNIIERALLVATGTAIEATDLALRAPGQSPDELGDGSLPELLEATERRLITRALAEADGVTAVAARRLGIPDRTLRYKIGRLGLRPGND
jgi:two-component system response regulator HydG